MSENTAAGLETPKPGKLKVSPKELLFKYLVYLPLFIVTLSISLGIAYIYLRYKIPYYSSSISILIRDDKGKGSADALDEIVLFKPKTNLANEIEILKSATLMEKVVRARNFNMQYWVEGNLKRTEIYNNSPFLYESINQKDTNNAYSLVLNFNKDGNFQVQGLGTGWFRPGSVVHANHGDFKITLPSIGNVNPEYKYTIQWLPPFQMAGGIASGLGIKQLNREATILNISMVSEIPQKGLDVLNELVKAYNNTTIENKNRVVDNTVKFIDNRLIFLTNDLGKVEQGLQEFRTRNDVVDIQKQGDAQFEKLTSTDEKLAEVEIKLQVINMIYQYINSPAKKYSLVPSSLGIEDATLASLIGDYNQLQLQREEKLKVMPEANPVMQVLENQIEKVRLNIMESLNNVKKPVESLRDNFQVEYNTLRGQLRTVPTKERELLEIERQQGIKEKLYLFLLQKREESAITVASSTSNASPIDPASVSWAPVSPDRSGTYRTAIIIGLLIPLAFIYLKDLLNDKITSRADITNTTDMPVVGEIAHHQMTDREVVIGEKDRSMIAEQFRMTRTNIQYFVTNKTNPVILVTSSLAGEGKTFTSMNLGAVWAVANKKTVILELDLRKPKISKALGLLSRKGISNYILGDAEKEELAVPVESVANLYVVPAGPVPPNPSELLLNEKISILFDYLKANFDIIIIDSAPLGLVSDARVLSSHADATVYVIRQRFTPKKQLDFINDMHARKLLPGLGLLVNDVKLTGLNSYYGYGYGYGYSYGYGFNQSMAYNYGYSNSKNPNWFKRIWQFFT